jgi:type III secretion protein T
MLKLLLEYYSDEFLAIALILPRIAAAFVMLPLFTQENVPALVRNSFMVSLAIAVASVVSQSNPAALMGNNLLFVLMLKEFFIGLMLGFCFSGIFWAIGIAGNVIDTKVGTTMASITDPIQGHQTSLTGAFLSQFATWLFMATGGFMIFLDLLLGSFALWPVTSYLPAFNGAGMEFVVSKFAYTMSAAFVFAAPALVIMAVIDVGLGLMNRFSQQLNLFALTTSIKALVAVFVLLLLLGFYVEYVIRNLFEQKALLNLLDGLI